MRQRSLVALSCFGRMSTHKLTQPNVSNQAMSVKYDFCWHDIFRRSSLACRTFAANGYPEGKPNINTPRRRAKNTKGQSWYNLLEDGTNTDGPSRQGEDAVAVAVAVTPDRAENVAAPSGGDDGADDGVAPNKIHETGLWGPDGMISTPNVKVILFLVCITQVGLSFLENPCLGFLYQNEARMYLNLCDTGLRTAASFCGVKTLSFWGSWVSLGVSTLQAFWTFLTEHRNHSSEGTLTQ